MQEFRKYATCLPRYVLLGIWEAGQPGHWKYRSRAHIVRASSVGADEELCPTSAVNRSVTTLLLGAHIEAAAGYGPVAVYAELLVSWPGTRCENRLLESVVHIGETWPFNFGQEFCKFI